MNRLLVTMLAEKAVQMEIEPGRPTAPGDGVSIEPWKTNGQFSAPLAALFVSGTEALELTSPTGGANGVELWGFRDGKWWVCGYVNNGYPVPIAGEDLGFAQEIQIVGIFSRLYVCGTPSAGTATAKLAPLPQWSTP